MKKVLSLVLVIAMVLSSMSFAFASAFEDVTGDYEKAIETLSALGVIDGYEDGTYRPEKVVTRAEMAKLMVVSLGYGDLVAGSKSNFADTQGHWADAYIALAAGKGIVIGDGNGNFRPDATVSYDEVYTMLVRGLGYTDGCNELKGMTWPTNFKVKAADLDITDGVAMKTTAADRGGVAQAIFNALQATLVTVDSDGDVTLMVDRNENQVELFSRLADLDEDYDVTADVLDADNKNYAGALVDLAPYMFQNLDVYMNDADEVVYVKGSNSLIVEGTVDDVDGTILSIELSNGKVKDIDLESDDDLTAEMVFENGSLRENVKPIADLKDTDSIKVVADDKNGNGKIDEGNEEIVGFVTTEQTDVIRVEQEYVEGKAKLDGLLLPVDDDDDVILANITVTGDAESLEDIQEDDIVAEYLSEDETVTTLVVSRETVDGKVTRVDDDTYYIDGAEYDLAAFSIVDGFELGDEGVFFLDHNGELVDYDGSSVGPTNYAVVLGVEQGTITKKFDKISIDEYPQVKLATQDDETVIYDLYVKVDSNGDVTGSVKVGDDSMFDQEGLNEESTLPVLSVEEDDLIKYSLNKDGKISKIEVVKADVAAYLADADNEDNIDLDKASNKLVDGVVVFDQTDDYDVVDASALPTEFTGYAVRNSNGEIKVVVVATDEISGAAETSFVYLTKINQSYNDDNEEVQTIVIYTDGAKKTVLTDADDTVTGDTALVYEVTYDGDLVDTALEADDADVVTATAINARGGMIEIADEWVAMSAHATVIGVKGTTVTVRDLYDITKGVTEFKAYYTEGEIDLIIIDEN